MQKPTDEIDLLDLLAKTIRLIRNNTKILLLCLSLGIAAGLARHFTTEKVYQSKMILLSDILTSSYSERLSEILTTLIKEKNTKILSQRLEVTEAEAAKIVEIKIESVKKEKAEDEKESSTFIVTVEVHDNVILNKLQNGIVNYLRNNEFVNVRVQQRKFLYQTMMEKVDQEIKSLDSLKVRLSSGKPVYANSAEMLLVDPTNIYSKIIELNHQLVGYKNSLELVNSIQLVEGFTPFEKPVRPKLSISLVGGFSLGLIFAGLAIFIKFVRTMLRFEESKLGKA